MAFYIESADRPPESRLAGSDVTVGEGVALNGSGLAVPFDPSTHTIGDFLGVADNPRTGDQIAEDEDDELYETYEAAEDDRVVYGGDADRDRIKLLTPPDTTADPAASIADETTVGFAAVGGDFNGRIVEEGYTDDGDTQYGDGGAGTFVPLGVAYRDEATDFDEPARIEVRGGL